MPQSPTLPQSLYSFFFFTLFLTIGIAMGQCRVDIPIVEESTRDEAGTAEVVRLG